MQMSQVQQLQPLQQGQQVQHPQRPHQQLPHTPPQVQYGVTHVLPYPQMPATSSAPPRSIGWQRIAAMVAQAPQPPSQASSRCPTPVMTPTVSNSSRPQVQATVPTMSALPISPSRQAVGIVSPGRLHGTSSAHKLSKDVSGHEIVRDFSENQVHEARATERAPSKIVSNKGGGECGDGMHLQCLRELCRSCGLWNVPAAEVVRAMAAAALDGKLTRAQFLTCHARLLLSHGLREPPASVGDAVFDIFDIGKQHAVDVADVLFGLCLLCGGSDREKIGAVLLALGRGEEESGNESLGRDVLIARGEMQQFLTAVFKILLTPHMQKAMSLAGMTATSPQALASAAVEESFKAMGERGDPSGYMPLSALEAWLSAPRQDPSALLASPSTHAGLA